MDAPYLGLMGGASGVFFMPSILMPSRSAFLKYAVDVGIYPMAHDLLQTVTVVR